MDGQLGSVESWRSVGLVEVGWGDVGCVCLLCLVDAGWEYCGVLWSLGIPMIYCLALKRLDLIFFSTSCTNPVYLLRLAPMINRHSAAVNGHKDHDSVDCERKIDSWSDQNWDQLVPAQEYQPQLITEINWRRQIDCQYQLSLNQLVLRMTIVYQYLTITEEEPEEKGKKRACCINQTVELSNWSWFLILPVDRGDLRQTKCISSVVLVHDAFFLYAGSRINITSILGKWWFLKILVPPNHPIFIVY